MVSHTDRDLTRLSASSSNDIHASHGVRFRTSNPVRRHQHQPDDVISMLANMPENQRARQIGEWEDLRRQTFTAGM